MTRSISVVIPTFGRVDLVEALLDRLDNQTRRPDEVLLVDDTPGPEVQEAAAGRARYLRNPGRPSLPRSRNIGIEESHGDILVFLDSDVEMGEDYLERMVALLDDPRRPVAVQGWVPNPWRHRGLKRVPLALFLQGINTGDRMRFRLPFRNTFPDRPKGVSESEWLSGSNMVIHRGRLGDVRFDDALERYALGEDLDFALRLRNAGGTLLLDADTVVHETNAEEGRVEHRDLDRMRLVNARHILATHFPDRRWRAALTWNEIGWILQKSPPWRWPRRLWQYVRDRRALRDYLLPGGGVALPDANALYSFWE